MPRNYLGFPKESKTKSNAFIYVGAGIAFLVILLLIITLIITRLRRLEMFSIFFNLLKRDNSFRFVIVSVLQLFRSYEPFSLRRSQTGCSGIASSII